MTVGVVVRRLGELGDPAGLDDPDGIVPFSEEKLAAFRGNPLRGGDDDPAQLLAVVGERVVGRVDVFRGEVTAWGNPVRILWGSALHVVPEFRTTGAGAMLVARMSSLGVPVGGCGFSQAAIPVYRALRWTSFELPRWILLRHSRPVVERVLSGVVGPGARTGARALAAAVDPALAAYAALRRRGACVRDGLVVREVEQLPTELDEQLGADGAPIATHRSSGQLQWLIRASFGARGKGEPKRRLFLVNGESGAVAAYFVVKCARYERASRHGFRDLSLGSLQDWFIFDRSAVDMQSIVFLAADVLSRANVDAFEVCESEPEIGAVARRLGLRRAGSTHFMFRAPHGSPLADPAAQRRESWRITAAEGDSIFT